jgi:catechol 1,2-dioxygenase
MSSQRVAALVTQVVTAMKPDAPGADPALQARMAVVLRHLLEAAEEVRLTEAELGGLCAFLDRVAATKEWRFLTHVFGLDTLVTETTHGGDERRTVDNVEGPLYRAGAPVVLSPALIMRLEEAGERLFLSGRVVEAGTGRLLPHAELDVWQANAAGAYAEDDPSQPEWNFRRRVIADAAGHYEIETVVPGCYEIGDLSGMACGDLMRRLGRHGMRPGHVHLKLAASGMQPMTTLLYFRGDPWIDDDSIFSVRDDVTLTLVQHHDAEDMASRGVSKPFHTGTFDFALEPVSSQALQYA